MRRFFRITLKIFLWSIALFLLTSVGAVLYYKWMPVQVTPLMVIRACETGNWDWQHKWVPIDEISPEMPRAVIASEDQRFLKHKGFDFEEIKKAREEAENGGRVRGASTISQQTAKNVFLWPGRSWVRKGFEAYFTVLIEWIWGKERIMEVYLNSIEMAPGVYGVQAVAKYSFDTTPERLTMSQCALIAATLPNPNKYSSKQPSAYMKRRQKAIEKQMRNIGRVDFKSPK